MIEQIMQSPKVQALQQSLQNGDTVLIEELWNAPKAAIAALAQQATGKHVLILTGASQEESRLYHDFPAFTECPIIDFPAWETLPNEGVAPSPDIVGERYKALQQIATNKEPHILISSLQACLQKLMIPDQFRDLYLKVVVGEKVNFEALPERLEAMGYTRSAVASDKGEYAVRGGIVDIFPVSSPDPFRIEFWDDDIESIRAYDPIGQKSVRKVEEVEITPAQELELLDQSARLGTILNYLGSETVVIFDDLLALEDRYASLVSSCGKSPHFCSLDTFLDQLKPLQKLYWTQQPIEDLCEIRILDKKKGGYYSEQAPMHEISFEMFGKNLQAKRWISPFVTIGQHLLPDVAEGEQITGEALLGSLGKLASSDCDLHILCETELEQSNFKKRLIDNQITLPKQSTFHQNYLSSGFILHDSKVIFLSLVEITQHYKIRRQKLRSTYHTPPSEVFELAPGEMVVHLNNGIGRYLGMEKRTNHVGVDTEFLTLEYAENSKLYVPVDQAHLVSKYIGSSEETPKMHALGSKRWQRARAVTEKAIMGYANDLLELYAQRSLTGGSAYPEDTEDLQLFEEEFPFNETEDQLRAIADVKRDMTSEKSMDRLICGDVGYGKTEVAMRAAFKAVADGAKQVAVLVPTTVLAMQHYENFVERMRLFPIKVEVLSRFRTAKEARQVLEGVEKGTVDILIGTHRIVSKDVAFKDLGLIIIDEEQRFGVRAKEHLKKMKKGVDCLTLSATPIPRTLYMSLVGARDMSVINTPPQDRLPIESKIAEPNDIIIKNALLRELARDGQAFVIHNRVETIHGFASRIQKLLPKARILVGHGQMSPKELDIVFHTFKSGEADILVSTTIIENGIDIPNANTILVDRADRFGLADLYQIRGRVGRWNRRAYAYFLIPHQRAMPEVAQKRLNALIESSGYGGGMKLAMRDLEIRGAGDILGTEQSGHVAAVGFHLYCKLLKRTIQKLQGKISDVMNDTKVEIPFDARLPETYVNEMSLRMEFYQRFAEALSWEDIEALWDELKDRFGTPPEPALWLYHLSRVRVEASKKEISALKYNNKILKLEKGTGKEMQSVHLVLGPCKGPQDFESKVLKILV